MHRPCCAADYAFLHKFHRKSWGTLIPFKPAGLRFQSAALSYPNPPHSLLAFCTLLYGDLQA